jgi:phage terminase small subunit
MALTPKQELFCLEYIKTGNASEAYRTAYDAAKMKPATVNRSAKEVLDNPKIAARVEELRKPVVEAAQLTLAEHLRALKELRDAALAQNQFGPAVTAEVSRGKASGLYTEKQEITGKDGGPIDHSLKIEFIEPK